MAKENPTVSIGMPVYNGALWLGDSIESILKQTFDDLELIISDNASTDRTEEICRDNAARDPRIRYLRQPKNVGASENYNCVMREAGARYFKWASCNDICHKDFLARCIAPLQERPDVALCYPRTSLFTDRPDDSEQYFDGLDLQEDSPCLRFQRIIHEIRLNNVMNGLIRSSVLRHTPMIKPYYSSDVVLMAEVALHGKFVEVPEFLFFRRMDDASATSLKSESEVIEHYAPNKRTQMLFQNWRLHMGYFGAALRTPLALRERTCVLRTVARQLRWSRVRLFHDVLQAVGMPAARRRSRLE